MALVCHSCQLAYYIIEVVFINRDVFDYFYNVAIVPDKFVSFIILFYFSFIILFIETIIIELNTTQYNYTSQYNSIQLNNIIIYNDI